MVGSLDDLDRPLPDLAQRLAKLVASIAAIGEDVPEPRVTADDLGQNKRRAIAIRDYLLTNLPISSDRLEATGYGEQRPIALLRVDPPQPLLASRELGASAVSRELGALLADERMGEELVETLQVYFDSGENMRETARRMHLANRTVAYRLERIETLLGGPLDGELRRRLSVALLVRRLARTR